MFVASERRVWFALSSIARVAAALRCDVISLDEDVRPGVCERASPNGCLAGAAAASLFI